MQTQHLAAIALSTAMIFGMLLALSTAQSASEQIDQLESRVSDLEYAVD